METVSRWCNIFGAAVGAFVFAACLLLVIWLAWWHGAQQDVQDSSVQDHTMLVVSPQGDGTWCTDACPCTVQTATALAQTGARPRGLRQADAGHTMPGTTEDRRCDGD